MGSPKIHAPIRPNRRAGFANLLDVFPQELLTRRCVIPAKTRGGGRKIVPDRAVSLLKWRITFFPRHHCRIVPAIFFFQAEDGIRDSSVTGVQTCALPI